MGCEQRGGPAPVLLRRPGEELKRIRADGWNPAMLVPDAQDWPQATRRSLRLAGRHDLAQHFIVSAVIAAAGGTPIAAAAGVYKELSDARDGSVDR